MAVARLYGAGWKTGALRPGVADICRPPSMAGSSGLFITRDERRTGNVTGNLRGLGTPTPGVPVIGPERKGSGLDCQVPQLVLVGDQVQRGDTAAHDGEADDRDRVLTGAEQGAGLAVH